MIPQVTYTLFVIEHEQVRVSCQKLASRHVRRKEPRRHWWFWLWREREGATPHVSTPQGGGVGGWVPDDHGLPNLKVRASWPMRSILAKSSRNIDVRSAVPREGVRGTSFARCLALGSPITAICNRVTQRHIIWKLSLFGA